MTDFNIDLSVLVRQRFSSEAMKKAMDLVETEPPKLNENGQYETVSSDGETVYFQNILIDSLSKGIWGVTCTCPNGINRAVASCYHAAAAYLLAREEQTRERENER